MIEDILKKLVLETVMTLVKDRLVAAIPFLGMPIVSWIVSFLLSKFGGLIVDELGRVISFAQIDAQANAQNEAYKQEVQNLKAAVEAQDDAQIEKAKAAFKARLRELAMLPH